MTGRVTTKADLAELRSALRHDMADLRNDIAALEARLTMRIVIVGLALNSVTAAAVIAAAGWMLAG